MLTLPLAEISTEASAGVTVLQGIFYLGGGFGGIVVGIYYTLKLFGVGSGKAGKVEIMNHTMTVEEKAQFATKGELQLVEAKVAGLDNKLDTKFTELNRERSRSIAGLHDRIERETDGLRKEVKDDVGKVHDRVNLVLAGVSRLEGKASK